MNRWEVAWTAALVCGAAAAFLVVWMGYVPVGPALVLGGVAEAAGFGMTFWDLVETERRVRRFMSSVYGSGHFVVSPPTLRAEMRVFPPTVTVTPGPPLEDRVAALERMQSTVEDRIHTAVREARDQVTVEAARDRDRLREDLAAADRRVEDLISGITLGGMRVRRLGVWFFVIGLAAATAANLVAS